jgi:hypothetical protein
MDKKIPSSALQSFQHLEGIDIPDIEITDGWLVSDVLTKEDTVEAFAVLMSAIAQIEYQIDIAEIQHPAKRDNEWLASARCALKYKKAALQLINFKRSDFTREAKLAEQRRVDRLLIDHIKSEVSSVQFDQWLSVALERAGEE